MCIRDRLGGDIAADLVVVLPLADLVFVGAQDGALDNVAFALQLSIASFPLDAGLYALVRVGFGDVYKRQEEVEAGVYRYWLRKA